MREHIRIHHKDVCSDWTRYCKLYLTFDHSCEKEEIKDEIKMDVPIANPDFTTEETSEEEKMYSENPEYYSSVKEEVKVGVKMEVSDDDPEVETDEPAEEEKVYSDNVNDVVKVKCGHCGKIMEDPQRSKHMKIHHPGKLNNFHFIKKVYHRFVLV